MHRRHFIKTGLAASGLALLGTTGAAAEDDRYRPRGPWATEEQTVNFDGYIDNDQLTERLQKLDRRSDRIELRQIGVSAGRKDPLWEVTIGDGDEKMHIINQIHGDEPSGTEAIVQILQTLATGSDPKVEKILDSLTITIVPRANPDGSHFVGDDGLGDDGELKHRRINTTEWEDGDSRYKNANNYYGGGATYGTDVPGYDLNRGFNPDPTYRPFDEPEEWWTVTDEEEQYGYLDVPIDEVPLETKDGDPYDELWSVGLNVNPETRAITGSFLEADPDWAITHHHQGANVHTETPKQGGGPEWQSIMSVMAPYGPSYIGLDGVDYASFVGDGNPFMSVDSQKRSIQLSGLVNEQMERFGYGRYNTMTRFAYGPLWGSYLDALLPQTDAAGALYEVCHQSEERGHKARGTMVTVSVEAFMATFERIADGSIHDVDEMSYFGMPIAEGIANPHEGRSPPR